ncbi:four-carbon acid sugar kinase family protein [Nocardioides sp. YIM 152315]|uniref:four-carbon acid sugar kinase family protein n=1 Tax=Nocardioides sp. YIM 152315 TaxID=3031760 RepID=UPI0023D979D2|nr:four-carbon acid sugar kinase family protein [Nocardioides sp. YIM 152315]MDF1605778.1 four-carbon acid sugar kinase family protein [Nocardioides sp. YIM 152315]
MPEPGPLLGVVADDFTGACDLAATVSRAGVPATVLLDATAAVPTVACVVVALKSRTAPVDVAVAESVAAARALRAAGARWIYQKYCSTFDSTDTGNIGPVADALMDELGAATDLTTPATPALGRTVHRGHLFVGDRLLSESPLRHHPLTPMTDPDLVRVLGRQTSRPVSRGVVGPGHVVLDAISDDDLDAHARLLLERAAAGHVDLWGGASGLAAALARALPRSAPAATSAPVPAGRRLVIAGSCSEQTRAQVAHFRGPSYRVAPGDVSGALAFLTSTDGTALVYTSAAPAEVLPGAAAEIEATLAAIARRAVTELGVAQLLVAGGETSGAVCRELRLTALDVREHVGPGLAWCSPLPDPGLRVLLKSGNFGDDDLFDEAWL